MEKSMEERVALLEHRLGISHAKPTPAGSGGGPKSNAPSGTDRAPEKGKRGDR
jgi:hypothetical protein